MNVGVIWRFAFWLFGFAVGLGAVKLSSAVKKFNPSALSHGRWADNRSASVFCNEHLSIVCYVDEKGRLVASRLLSAPLQLPESETRAGGEAIVLVTVKVNERGRFVSATAINGEPRAFYATRREDVHGGRASVSFHTDRELGGVGC